MMVRFATVCDVCPGHENDGQARTPRRSEEYHSWPTCESCDSHVCPDCMLRLTVEADLDQPEMCLCVECGVDNAD